MNLPRSVSPIPRRLASSFSVPTISRAAWSSLAAVELTPLKRQVTDFGLPFLSRSGTRRRCRIRASWVLLLRRGSPTSLPWPASPRPIHQPGPPSHPVPRQARTRQFLPSSERLKGWFARLFCRRSSSAPARSRCPSRATPRTESSPCWGHGSCARSRMPALARTPTTVPLRSSWREFAPRSTGLYNSPRVSVTRISG
jgi:hypothetical protein